MIIYSEWDRGSRKKNDLPLLPDLIRVHHRVGPLIYGEVFGNHQGYAKNQKILIEVKNQQRYVSGNYNNIRYITDYI